MLQIESWHKNGPYHRDGYKPAYIEYNIYGEAVRFGYYTNGEELDEDDVMLMKLLSKRKNILKNIKDGIQENKKYQKTRNCV